MEQLQEELHHWKTGYAIILEERDSLFEEKSKLRAMLSKMEAERDEFRRKYTDLQLLDMHLSSQTRSFTIHEQAPDVIAPVNPISSTMVSTKAKPGTQLESDSPVSTRRSATVFDGVIIPKSTRPHFELVRDTAVLGHADAIFSANLQQSEQPSKSSTPSKRVFEKSNADHLDTKSPQKKQKMHSPPVKDEIDEMAPMYSGSSHSRFPSPSISTDLIPRPLSSNDHKPIKKQEGDDVAMPANITVRVGEQDSVSAAEVPLSPLNMPGDRPKGKRKTIVPDIYPAEARWLETQTECKAPMGKGHKPVKWKLLAERLAQAATPASGLRPLHQDTIGLAWNAKIWRFDDQQDLPIFTADFPWTRWIISEEGKAWKNKWATK